MAVVRQFHRVSAAAGVVHPVWLAGRHQRWRPRGLYCKVATPVILVAAAGPAFKTTEAQPPLPLITAEGIDGAVVPIPQQPQTQLQEAGQPSAAYCQADNLNGLFRQFGTYHEGFDNGLQLDGLMAYYRRLGCSAEQIQDAVYSIMPPIASSGGRAGGAGGLVGSMAQPDLDTALGRGAQAGPAGAGTAFAPEAGGSGGGGVSGMSYMEFSEPLWQPPASFGEQVQFAAWELLAATLAAAALAAYESRPRGWSRRDLLEVRQSNIAGRGVFARTLIPAGTVLGAYPGRLRSAAEMVAKCQEAPLAASYAFRTGRSQRTQRTRAGPQTKTLLKEIRRRPQVVCLHDRAYFSLSFSLST
ncbi:hypothetical protein Vretifemale_7709 [Volvox reticuliferus]|nr:hypothetical protein Vretifemale_7709 [Volvox reticuliferus]